MSKFQSKNVALAMAVAAALALPASAIAADAGYPAGTLAPAYTFASNLFGQNTSVIQNPLVYSVNTTAADNIIGRTTGFGIRLTLGNGANFSALAAPARGTALVGYSAPAVSAFTAGTNVAVISVIPDPAAAVTNINVGSLVDFAAGSIKLNTLVNALGTAGGSVPVTIELFDSNTAQVFQTITGASLATSVEGTTVAFDTSVGDVDKRIDVAACGSQAAKTRFSPNGTIGNSCDPTANTDRTEFNAGAVVLGVTGLANGFAGANNSGNPNAGTFQYALTDTIDVTVSGTNFAAFDNATNPDRIYLSTAANCDVAAAMPATRAITGNNSIVLKTTANDWSVTGGTKYVCLATTVAAATAIAAQPLTASVAIGFTNPQVKAPANRGGNLLPLRNNGTVLEFQNVNPAANARAQSFIRLTNNSSIACPVSITGRDDNGVAGASAIKATLAVGNSLTLNSDNLEAGSTKATGAFGDGAGRWYVTVDAECAGMVGSALNRNMETGTVTNLTPDKR